MYSDLVVSGLKIKFESRLIGRSEMSFPHKKVCGIDFPCYVVAREQDVCYQCFAIL